MSETLSISQKRLAGFVDAISDQGSVTDPGFILTCSGSDESNYKKIKDLLQSESPPDGIFTLVEKLVVATYLVCNDLGIKIPDQLKLISFSNLATAPLLNPSLSTIAQPAFDIGKKSAEVLFNIIEGREIEDSKNTIVLDSILTIRDSTNSTIL